MMKKLLTLWMFIIVGSLSTVDAQNVDLYLDTVSVESGNNVTVEFTAENFTDIFVLEIAFQWDSTVLEFVSYQDLNSELGFQGGDFSIPDSLGRSDIFKVAWNDVSGKTLPDGSVVFSMTFKAVGANGTQSPIDYIAFPRNLSIVQDSRELSEMEIEEALNPGLVNVTDGGGGTTSVDLIGSDETVMSGEEACVDVSVRDFDNIQSMDVFMRYDESVIEYKEVRNLNLPQLTQGNFTNVNPGELRLSYNNPNGASVDDNTVIYEVCYDAIGNNGTSSDFDFTGGNPNPPLEVVNTDNESLDVNTTSGSVQIGGGTGGDLYYEIEDVEIGSEEICVPIRVSGYQDIVGFTFSVNFDEDYMSFEEVRNFAFSNATFGINDTEINQGNIGFLWSTSDGNAKSLSDQSVLFELCFSLNGSCGEGTGISFSDEPVERVLNDESGGELDPEYRNGNLSCEGREVIETVTDVSCEGDCDGAISLEINGWDVESITWSDNSLPDQANVSGLCAGTYGVTVTYTDGIEISNDNIEVETTPGPTISINEIQADLGSSDGSIDIDASGSSLTYEWSNGDMTEDLSGVDAGTYSVTVTNGEGCSEVLEGIVVLSVDADVTDASCGNSEDGEISTAVSGGSGNYEYSWSCSSSTEASITDLAPGECTLTITDVDGGYENVVTFNVDSPPPIVLSDVETMSDDGSGNGSIDITVSGGNPPYSYEWIPTGDTTEDINGLSNGSYIVIITDDNGCVFRSQPIDVGKGGPIISISTSEEDYNGFGVSCAGDCNGYINVETFNLDDVEITWDDGNEDFNRSGLCAGAYAYTITSEGSSVQEDVINLEEPDEFEITNIDVECSSASNGSAEIEVSGGVEPYLYSWDGITYDENTSASGLSTGDYTIFVRDNNGCELMDEYEVEECDDAGAECFDGRKVITPNGDNRNDELVIRMCGDIETSNLKIYAQWGELVYEESNYSNDWEGVSNSGDRLDDGVYFWVLRVTTDSGVSQTYKGSVNIVRTMN